MKLDGGFLLNHVRPGCQATELRLPPRERGARESLETTWSLSLMCRVTLSKNLPLPDGSELAALFSMEEPFALRPCVWSPRFPGLLCREGSR